VPTAIPAVGIATRARSLRQRLSSNAAGVALRVVSLPYAALALIPATFGFAGGVFHLQGDRERMRGCLLWSVAGTLSLPGSLLMLLAYPAVLLVDNDKRYFYDRVMRKWARGTWYAFAPPPLIEDRMGELPAPSARIVYMSNHQSWLDIFALCHLDHPFKFVAKVEISYIPVIGWVLDKMLGHVVFDRKSKDGGKAAIQKSADLVHDGIPVLWFPEVSANGERERERERGGKSEEREERSVCGLSLLTHTHTHTHTPLPPPSPPPFHPIPSPGLSERRPVEAVGL